MADILFFKYSSLVALLQHPAVVLESNYARYAPAAPGAPSWAELCSTH